MDTYDDNVANNKRKRDNVVNATNKKQAFEATDENPFSVRCHFNAQFNNIQLQPEIRVSILEEQKRGILLALEEQKERNAQLVLNVERLENHTQKLQSTINNFNSTWKQVLYRYDT